MRHRLIMLAAAVAAGALAGTAGADAVYQTERLELRGVAGAPGGGMVVNIHPNGPRVFAQAVYTLQHATPGTYQVLLNLFPTSLDCTGDTVALPTATLTTNRRATDGRA